MRTYSTRQWNQINNILSQHSEVRALTRWCHFPLPAGKTSLCPSPDRSNITTRRKNAFQEDMVDKGPEPAAALNFGKPGLFES